MDSASTSADNKNNRFVSCEVAKVKSGCFIAKQKLLSDRRTCKNSFSFRKVLECFWEIAAYFSCFSHSNLVGKSWCHIRFVDNHWNMTASSGKNNRYRHEASLRKYDIRFDFFHKSLSLKKSMKHTEWIRQILKTSVSS